MAPWLESLGVAALAGVGVGIGAWFSRCRGRIWLLGYFGPLALIIIYAAATRHPALSFVPPVSWMMAGRTKFAIIGFVGCIVLTTPLSRLRGGRERVMVALLMAVLAGVLSVWPFLAPAFNRRQLTGIITCVDQDGVCRQSTDYTCGPAAAVTVLRRLGFKADEGEIAILAHTTSATGTPPDILADALRERYAREGLVCRYRVFRDAAELEHSGLTLAVIKYNLILDHYVAVLGTRDHKVLLGDPLDGLTEMSYEDFERIWRHTGVQLHLAI